MADSSNSEPDTMPVGPFRSLRQYVRALEARGRVLHIDEVDQDAYEATGLLYRLIDRHGWSEAPAIRIERIKTNGTWVDGPVFGNLYGRWEYEPLVFGGKPDTGDQGVMYRSALAHLESHSGKDGQWNEVPPVEVSNDQAPCKEVALFGDAVDILKFPIIKTNPADGGAYINTGNVVLEDPERGRNVGTYRCQVKGPRKLGINPERNQHGWTFLMDMKERGEPFARVAVVLGADPVVFAMSSSKAARLGQDELAVAGGLLGHPVEVVKCETSDLRIPANAEMVIEGEIQFDFEPEGPFGEMYGYIGERKAENFYMKVTAVTHRRKPIFVNNFTGVQRGFLTAPLEINANRSYRQQMRGFSALHFPLQTPGYCFVRVDKKAGADTMAIGRAVATTLKIGKIVVVVDDDVDIHNYGEVVHAVGSRWQPQQSTEIIESAPAMGGDPSSAIRGQGSRIVIDATRKSPEEGGPAEFARMNRECLLAEDPDIFERIDEKWGDTIRGWKP